MTWPYRAARINHVQAQAFAGRGKRDRFRQAGMRFWFMAPEYALFIVLIDGIFALLCYMMIARFCALTLLPEQLTKGRLPFLSRLNTILFRILSPVTPHWINHRSLELYALFWLFMIRYYLLPLVIGYQIYLPTEMPFERAIFDLFSASY